MKDQLAAWVVPSTANSTGWCAWGSKGDGADICISWSFTKLGAKLSAKMWLRNQRKSIG